MANKNLTNRILNQLKQKPRARGNTGPFVLPNHSGDHSAGIVRDAPTAGEDIVNKTYADTKAAASHTHAITDITSTTSAQLATLISDETGSGSLVFSSSPTISSAQLQTPILGTPQSGDLSNCTGTAAGLTAGNVTTNANLFGHVTSVGNSASLGSFSSSQLKTALTDETGSGSAVFATSPTLVTPLLGTPTSGTLTNCTGLPITGITSTTSAQLATLISDETGSGALVFANSPALTTPTLGTPASGTLTNCTGLPITGITSTTSAQLATLISDETGSGALVFANSPALTTPTLGTPASGTLTNCTGLPITGITSTTSAQLATLISDETGSGALVFANSPALTTPTLGTPASGTLTNCTGLPITGITSTTSAQLATLISDETGSGALVF